MNAQNLLNLQKETFLNGKTHSYEHRESMLLRLKEMLEENEQMIYQALYTDLNKSKHETLTTELGILYTEIDFALKNLSKWMKNESVPAPLTHQGTKNYIIHEPLGNVLIISPWNYPLQLAIAPAIGALAAGNTVILKPSELAPATEELLSHLIKNYFDEEYFGIITGDKDVSDHLVGLRFDYIFFTGSTQVGKKIMKRASENLTPLTLELGGKSPAIITADANIKLTAKRIAWGKFTNAGQTCVAPDYIYIEESIKNKFLKELVRQTKRLYKNNPLNNENYVKIINSNHFNRLMNFINQSNELQLIYGGSSDETTLKIEPTILQNISWEDDVMQEEIFGPILPILTFTDINEAISAINQQEKPLALYFFGKDESVEAQVLKSIRFGGGAINDTLYHLANPHLPFGGIGHSGLGAYHGKYSYETFTHKKSIMEQTTKFDLPFRYPNSKLGKRIVKYILK